MTKIKNITCPACQKSSIWHTDNPYRPFCSERCKLIDLGAWAAEKHRVAGEDIHPDELTNDENET